MSKRRSFGRSKGGGTGGQAAGTERPRVETLGAASSIQVCTFQPRSSSLDISPSSPSAHFLIYPDFADVLVVA